MHRHNQSFLGPAALTVAALVVSSLAGTTACGPGARLVDRAAEALGGADRIRGVHALTIDGDGEVFALGQNRTADGPVLKWVVTGYRRTIDLDRGRWRDTSTQTAAFVTGWPDPFPVVAGYDDDVAYDVDDGHASRLDAITARDRRAEVYHHPIGFLRAALAAGARVEEARVEGNQDAVDLIIATGERFTLYADRTTHLPQRIASKSHVAALGDVTVETTFGAFVDAGSNAAAPIGGPKVPSRVTTRVDGTVVRDLRISKTAVNPAADAGGDLLAPPDARAAPMPRPARVTVEEAAPGIWYVAGEGHHSVVAEFADHLTLIEAPVDDTRTLAVIGMARTLRPGKPVTQVINTHHHFDHAGGIRAAIAEGLTVITHDANRRFYEQVARRPATAAPDWLARHAKPLRMEAVSTQMVLTDGARRLEIHPITDSPHSGSMLMVYFPNERLLVEADAYQPPPLAGAPPRLHPFAANLLDNVRARGLRVDRVLPLHGRIVPFAELVSAARTSPQGTR